MLVQTLSNMITANEQVISQFWETHVAIEERKHILMCAVVPRPSAF